MNTLKLLLQLAGVMHAGLIAAGICMSRVTDFKGHAARLPVFHRQLFWVYFGFIGLCLVSFGSLTLFLAGELAGGGPLARAVCVFLAVFWLARWTVAMFVLDVTPFLTNTGWKIGYHATNIVFTLLPVIYLLAAWKGGAR